MSSPLSSAEFARQMAAALPQKVIESISRSARQSVDELLNIHRPCVAPAVVRTREPEKFQYIEAGTVACPDDVIAVCRHRDTIPVDSAILGAPVAEICLTCDEQLPVPWPEEMP